MPHRSPAAWHGPTVLLRQMADSVANKNRCQLVNRDFNPMPKGAECRVELFKPSRMVQAKEPID
jgi:hypothetical protein